MIRQRIGYWLVGAIAVTGIVSVINLVLWSESRTSHQMMEGGWTRTVIDHDLQYLTSTYVWMFGIALVAWTLGSIAYYLIEEKT